MNPGKALVGVFAGIAAGAVLGVLFAPEKGSNTRQNLAKRGDDLAHALNRKIDEKFDELMNTITAKMKKGKSQNDEVPSNKAEFAS